MDVNSLPQNVMAALLGVTARTLRDWEKTDDPPPRNPDGSYDGPLVVGWFVERQTAKVGELNPQQELARKNAALADKTELENAVTRGKVGLITEVARVIVPECRRLIHEARAELAAACMTNEEP